jgi:hypothetical protein
MGTEVGGAARKAGHITRIKGLKKNPFSEDQIADIFVTHDKWSFAAER